MQNTKIKYLKKHTNHNETANDAINLYIYIYDMNFSKQTIQNEIH